MTCPATAAGLLACDLPHRHTGDHHDPDTGQHWTIDDTRYIVRGSRP